MIIISSGIVTIASGVISSNLEVVQEGSIHILNNGRVSDSVLADGGTAVVSKGGILYSCTISSGGTGTVLNSGYAQDITVEKDGLFLVSSGGTAHLNTIKSGGTQILYEDTAAASTFVMDGGTLLLSSGGYARNPVVSQNGAMRLLGDSLVNGGEIYGLLELNAGGTADSVKVLEGGEISVLSDGYVSMTEVESGGSLSLSDGATGQMNTVYDHGSVLVSSGGVIKATTISGGLLEVKSDGYARTVLFESKGYLRVSSGGTATKIYWTPCEGIVEIADGAEVTFASQYSGVYYGSDNTLLSNASSMESRTLGTLETMYVMSGGTSIDTTVGSEGRMDVFSGGKLTGKQTFENGAIVSMCGEAVLDFDLTRTEAGKAALVNDLSVVRGTPVYMLTVSDSLGKGVYSLADGASGFSSTLSVVNSGGAALGSLTVGDTIKVGDTDYTLNLTDSLLTLTVVTPAVVPTNLVGTPDMVSWDSTGSANYVVEYSTDDFENALQITTFGTAVDMYELPTGMYQWRVKADEGEEWAVGNEIESEAGPDDPKAIWSNEDGNSDLFFASANGTWDACYYAQHVGSINDWTGTNECVSANGKGRIQNLFFGSSDSNVLCLTDGENGDAIFVDDAYTELPEEIERNTARLYRIQEIRAGAGDDIVDMTSQRFEYTGEGLTIHGGEGNDTIWASKGKNILFGDAGNDRIVGASDSDIIAGGIGNDRMHGGGGVDVFTFCDNWGNDTVQQLGSGTVTLWFASGSELNWNTETLTYSDGDNSVTVSGVTSVTLKFGDDGSEDYDILFGMGAFFDATTERIFEESGQGILASL
jgi:autotransporter passenger strand-loop-strand repeat protein